MLSTLQAPSLANVLAEAFPDKPEIAAAFASIAGNCQAPIWHRGAVWLQGPQDTSAVPQTVVIAPPSTYDEANVQNANYNLMQQNLLQVSSQYNYTQTTNNFFNSSISLVVGDPPVGPPSPGDPPGSGGSGSGGGSGGGLTLNISEGGSFYYTLNMPTVYIPSTVYINTIIYDHMVPSGKPYPGGGGGTVWCEKEIDVPVGSPTIDFNCDEHTITMSQETVKCRVLVRCEDDPAHGPMGDNSGGGPIADKEDGTYGGLGLPANFPTAGTDPGSGDDWGWFDDPMLDDPEDPYLWDTYDDFLNFNEGGF